MKVRLVKVRSVKPGVALPDKKDKQRPVDVPIIDTIRSWVEEFRLGKANGAHLDFGRMNSPIKR